MCPTIKRSQSMAVLGANPTSLPGTFRYNGAEQRVDIIGLRGVAVLALLAVHLVPGWSAGGGVIGFDIFFVISGFLITHSLLASPAGSSRSLLSFYARRLHAVVPALTVTLASCLAFAWLFTTPAVLMDLGRLAASAAFAVSNSLLWRDDSAVTLGPNGSPLFHLWAVALMVQWCLVWPLVVRVVVAKKISLVAVVTGICGVSFLLELTWVGAHTDATFFLLPTRSWETIG